jgi:hypothetical protein
LAALASAGAAPRAAASIEPSTAPGATVSPSLARMSPSVPGRGRVDLERHLVGLELEDRLVGLHGVARLLEPAADGGLRDGFAEGRHADFGRHGVSLLGLASRPPGVDPGAAMHFTSGAKTSSRKACSCAMCFDISPVAVAAEAARPT